MTFLVGPPLGSAQSADAEIVGFTEKYCSTCHNDVDIEGGLDLTGQGVKLDLKRQDTGAVVASLDIPIALHINVNDLAVTLRDATIKLDVVR